MYVRVRCNAAQGILKSMTVPFAIFLVFLLLTTDKIDSKSLNKRWFGSSAGTHNSSSWSSASSSSVYSSSEPLNYHVVVAYQAKDRKDPIYAKLKGSLQSATGEDNYFVAARSSNELYAGVADGVGGWANHGYDSSAISRELCNSMREIASTSSKDILPKQLIDYGYKDVLDNRRVEVGGTTAIVAHFLPNGTLNVANLGDSWCGVFRDSKLAFQTKFQTVGFNAPYQLAVIPKHILDDAERRGGSFIMNKPSDADDYTFKLQKNDVVVLATDGVTDNISIEDMEIFLRDKAETNQDLQGVAQEFVSNVVALSKDPSFPSVFAQEYSKMSGQFYVGGKEDDITVVVVKVE